MIVGIIGFILVVFLSTPPCCRPGKKTAAAALRLFLLEVLTHPETAGVIAAAAMAAVKTCGCVNLTSAPARIPRLYAVLAAVSRVYSSYLPSSFIQHQLQIRHYSFSCLT